MSASLAAVQDATFAAASAATVTSYPPERRLSGALLASVLTTRRYAVLSTTRPDGRPHATPTSFVLSGSALWLPTVAGAARARNVRAQPYAVLVLSEGERGAHLAVIAEGPVTVEPLSPEAEADAVAQLDTVPDWAAHWLVLRPARLMSYAAEEWTL